MAFKPPIPSLTETELDHLVQSYLALESPSKEEMQRLWSSYDREQILIYQSFKGSEENSSDGSNSEVALAQSDEHNPVGTRGKTQQKCECGPTARECEYAYDSTSQSLHWRRY